MQVVIYPFFSARRIEISFTTAYTAGKIINVRIVAETMPPTIGAAMRRMTSEPVPVLSMTGNKPTTLPAMVIMTGRMR